LDRRAGTVELRWVTVHHPDQAMRDEETARLRALAGFALACDGLGANMVASVVLDGVRCDRLPPVVVTSAR
jgi:hypothetical protein